MKNHNNSKNEAKEIKINNFPKEYVVNIKEKGKIPWSNIFAFLAIIISILSFLYAIGYLGSSEITIYSEGIYLSLSSDKIILFTLPMTYINTGSKAGVIEDIYIILNDEIKFEPLREIDTDLQLEYGINPRAFGDRFIPFGLNKNEEKFKNILFYPTDKKPLINKSMPLGFDIKIFLKEKDKPISLEKNQKIIISKANVESLLNGDVLFVWNNSVVDTQEVDEKYKHIVN